MKTLFLPVVCWNEICWQRSLKMCSLDRRKYTYLRLKISPFGRRSGSFSYINKPQRELLRGCVRRRSFLPV